VSRLGFGLAVVVLWSCSGERKAEPTPAPGDAASPASGSAAATRPTGACGYISEADASEILDQPSKYRPHQATSPTCSITPASGDAFRGTSVDFSVSRGTTRMYDFLEAQKQSEAVGLGDRALWLAAGETRGNLVVVKGADEVSLTISDFNGAGGLKGRARTFARKVLERVP